MNPEVSIIVPMRNAESYVVKDLTSILLEEKVSLELIVVNDQLTDGSLRAVLALKDRRILLIDGSGRV